MVVSDYRMPGMSGVEFLRAVKERWPRIQRVLLTGQADSTAIEEAVNQSEIFRFIWKPWDDGHLLITIQSAVDQYWIVEDNIRLQRPASSSATTSWSSVNRDLDGQLSARSAALVRAAQEWRACFDALGDPLAILQGRRLRGGPGQHRLRARRRGRRRTCWPGLSCTDHGYGSLPCPARCAMPATAAPPSGRSRSATASGCSAPSPSSRAAARWWCFKDVTDEREVTRRLFHAEKMSAVGQLAGGVAHEINNPLGGILAFAQLMSREERSAEDMENLRLIQDAANRAKRIVESLLRFSRRPREEEKGPVPLPQVVDDALFLLSSQLKDGRTEVVRRCEPAVAIGNANQLQQIVVNLLVNALQAMNGEGTRHHRHRRGRARAGSSSRSPTPARACGPRSPSASSSRSSPPSRRARAPAWGCPSATRSPRSTAASIRVETGAERGACFVLELPAARPRVRNGRMRKETQHG